ncbi:DUF1553 domain-containing protein [Rubinisphaera brasiliensis]|uniref:LamG-like jellyroll fold domain-containing protein n=1 Tax=Rubinisphaera brasiliensis (strain ATCC 49424 / DSM 5305 / JCM 21570 / IAM 15109 / NBRC 103401 / IFAM 1448) TaxID=756272 RepID=F0SNU1_RUBBR|nr:DUF1553 domain-containing protein [Rubinisphaera brasiliensis]ADY58977.1 protein of unknown function DUF1549 [Rubinisphaera brasiliensis DSM 5305]
MLLHLRTRCALTCLALLAIPALSQADDSTIDFNRDIRPILSENCFFCHGPDPENREADLRLDDRQAAIDFLAIVPGSPDESELLRRIESHEEYEVMPPPDSKRSLTPQQIATLKQWIAEGADYAEHWSFTPINPTEPPEVNGQSPANPIDAFVAAQLARDGRTLNPKADRATILRRVYYDLTGLPPSPAELRAFLDDDSPDALEKVVDKLFASPAYAERMTSEWLDVARYSDSYGYQVDRDRFVWPWRDWVIRAFEQNMPYDQFITEQLAGDLLPNATDDQILATTFNRLHPQKVEGGSVPEEFRIEYIADRTQTFGTAFLGLTMECARCHTHKYDPITQKEYYQFSAYFDNIDEAGLYSYFTPAIPTPTLLLAKDDQKQQLAKLADRIAADEHHLQQVSQQREAAFQAWLKNPELPHPEPAEQPAQPQAAAAEKKDDAKKEKQPAPVPPHELIPGRVAYLPFEDKAVGRNKIVDGPLGQALQLTGDDAVALEVGNFTRNDPFSVSLWLNTPDLKERAVIFHRSRAWTDAASRGYELLLEEGKLSAALIHFWPGNALRVKALEPLPTGEWVHVTVRYDGSSRAAGLQLFVNGQPVETETVRDQLTKNITGGGNDVINIGERFRDRGFKGGSVDEFQVFDRQLSALEIAQLHDGSSLQQALNNIDASEDSNSTRNELREFYLLAIDPQTAASREQLRKTRQERSQLIDPIPEIMVMREMETPKTSHLLERGVYDNKGEKVYPAVLAKLHPYPENSPANRLGLAQWLTSTDNPLTARVTVNRYWQMLFGEGLVRTPEDFGSQGEPPTHPELLDWLAHDFLTHGWDVQRLLKQIVLSDTYQQSSQVTPELLAYDPENRKLSRFPRRRLPAEMIRDTALAVSGLLVEEVGGAPVRPYEVEASFKPTDRSKGDGLYRRSLYTYWKRNAPAPVMLALDASLRDVCRVQRDKTMSPLQAFVLLNGPQFVEASRVYAERLLAKSNGKAEQTLDDLFLSLTARQPTDAEREVLLDLLAQEQAHYDAHPQEAAEFLQTGDSPINDTLPATDVAALAIVINTLLNFDDVQMQR